MSFRPQAKEPVIVNGDMSGTLTSKVSIIPKLSMNTYSYSWSGTSPVGTVTVQLSNDYTVDAEGNTLNAGTWNTIPFVNSSGSTVTSFAVSGNTGTGFLEVTTGAYAMRTVYTFASGTGSLQVVYNSKVT